MHWVYRFNVLTLKESCWFGNGIVIHSTCGLQRVQDHVSFVVLKYTVILFRVRSTDHYNTNIEMLLLKILFFDCFSRKIRQKDLISSDDRNYNVQCYCHKEQLPSILRILFQSCARIVLHCSGWRTSAYIILAILHNHGIV